MRAHSRRESITENGSKREVRRWREREKLEPSAVWQTVAILFVGLAFSAGVAAASLSDAANVRPAEFWILTGAFVALALTCFLAHWDVNRSRRTKLYETEELPAEGD